MIRGAAEKLAEESLRAYKALMNLIRACLVSQSGLSHFHIGLHAAAELPRRGVAASSHASQDLGRRTGKSPGVRPPADRADR